MSQKPGRLPSLRGPRDLTLGGVKKKTFAPKIPVRKERNKKEQNVLEPRSQKKEVSKRGKPTQRGRGRGRGRGRHEIIQSHSIFEAGPSTEPAKRSSDGGFSTSSGLSKDIQRPTLKHEVTDEDFENSKTEEALRNLESNSSFLEDLESDETLLPTCLPMSLSSWPPSSTKSKLKNVDDSNSDCSQIFKDCLLKQESDSPTIIVFQLPDSLPAMPPSTEVEMKHEAKVKSEPGSASKQEATEESERSQCTLDQLPEGYVGKLQVMKSGRARLVMGGIVLDLNAGTPSSFLEELTAVEIPSSDMNTMPGTISVLGNVTHKVICSPDMETLIQQCRIECETASC